MRKYQSQSRGRSAFYSSWLREQAPDRQRELLAAERAYLGAADSPTGERVAVANAYMSALRGVAELDPGTAT